MYPESAYASVAGSPMRRAISSASSLSARRRSGGKRVVAERTAGEACEQPHPQRAVLVPDGRERPLEQRHELGVVARDVPDDPAAVAERRAGELLGEAERSASSAAS